MPHRQLLVAICLFTLAPFLVATTSAKAQVAQPPDVGDQLSVNFIDVEILAALSDRGIPVSPRANNNKLIRRVFLDLAGRLPTPAELAATEDDDSDQAYASLVDRLLASNSFADFWTLKFARWLRVRSLPDDTEATHAYTNWIRNSIKSGMRIDKFSRQLLTATGDSHRVGPANFSRMAADAHDQAKLVSHFFLGTRMECASCHNHPLDHWTQDDFHGLAAVFAKVVRGREVYINVRGSVTNARTGQPAIAKLPGDRLLESSADARVEFANWLLSSGQQDLAVAMVNRLWHSLLGRGLVDPPDDIRNTNPATHPRLLERLAEDFIDHGYDFRHTLKTIALSETYKRSRVPVSGNQLDNRFYSHAYFRPLEPEVLADAIADVTEVPNQFPNQPRGARAVTFFDPPIPVPTLEQAMGYCSIGSEVDESMLCDSTSSRLHLVNSEFINSKLGNPTSFVHRSIEAGRADREIIVELFRRALCEAPDPARLQAWANEVASSAPRDRETWIEDSLLCLLNSYEFTNNH